MPYSTIRTKAANVYIVPQTREALERIAAISDTTISNTIHQLALDKLSELHRVRGEVYIPAPFRFRQEKRGRNPTFFLTCPVLGRVELFQSEAEMLANRFRGPQYSRPGDLDSMSAIDGKPLRVQRRGRVVWLDLGEGETYAFSSTLAASLGERMLEVIAAAKP